MAEFYVHGPIGADGYELDDFDFVYLLEFAGRPLPLGERMRRVDYFHGVNAAGVPICQLCGDKLDMLAYEMISTSPLNPTIRRIAKIQKAFRISLQWKTYHVPVRDLDWTYQAWSRKWYYIGMPWTVYHDPLTGRHWKHQASSDCAFWC